MLIIYAYLLGFTLRRYMYPDTYVLVRTNHCRVGTDLLLSGNITLHARLLTKF